MSGIIKLKPTLPKVKDGLNGIDALYEEVMRKPSGTYVVAMVVEPIAIRQHVEGDRIGEKDAELAIVHVEGLLGEAADAVRKAMDTAARNRKPNEPTLDFDV